MDDSTFLEDLDENKKAEYYRSLNIDDKIKEQSVTEIKEWLSQQSFANEVLFSDKVIENVYLRLGDVEKSKEKLTNYYHLKYKYYNILMPCDPADEHFREETRAMYAEYLPKLTPEGYRVHVTQYLSTGADKFDFTKSLKLINMKLQLYLEEGKLDLGTVALVDCKKLSMKIALSATPLLRSIVAYVQQVIPIRVKGIVFVNVNRFIAVIVNWLKLLFKAKLRDRVFIYSGGVENFVKHVPLEMLPRDFGGPEIALEELRTKWETKLKEHRTTFLNEIKLFEDKLKKPEKAES